MSFSPKSLFTSLQAPIRRGVTTAKMGRAFIRLVSDPTRLDVVFALSDGLDDNPEVFEPILAAFRESETGRQGLAKRTRVRIEMPTLEALAADTLGAHYAAFIRREGLDPKALFRNVDVSDGVSGESAWVFEHFYETHDIWHTVTGFGTDVAGELGLQAFYLAQFPARLAALLLGAGMLNTFLFGFEDRDPRMSEIARGWAMGKASQSFLGIDWAAHWDVPLTEIRRRLNIDVAEVALAA